jgi:hypothetical protein
VQDDGVTWVDGTATSTLSVAQGWHEVMISNSTACRVTLPGGDALSYPSSLVSTVPMEQTDPQSFHFLISFTTSGHEILVAFSGSVESYGF